MNTLYVSAGDGSLSNSGGQENHLNTKKVMHMRRILALLLMLTLLLSAAAGFTVTASAAGADSYIPVVEQAIAEAGNCNGGGGYGCLYDMDKNGTKELILVYPTFLTMANGFDYPCYVCSAYTLSGGTVVTLMEKEKVSILAGGSSGWAGIVEKEGNTYLAVVSTSSIDGDDAEKDGSWMLYSLDGTHLQQSTSASYVCFEDMQGNIVSEKSSAVIDGVRDEYSAFEEWTDSFTMLHGFSANGAMKAEDEETTTLEYLLAYLKENPEDIFVQPTEPSAPAAEETQHSREEGSGTTIETNALSTPADEDDHSDDHNSPPLLAIICGVAFIAGITLLVVALVPKKRQ